MLRETERVPWCFHGLLRRANSGEAGRFPMPAPMPPAHTGSVQRPALFTTRHAVILAADGRVVLCK
jgi:hypothetical protein